MVQFNSEPNLLLVSDLHLGDPHLAGRSEAFARWLDDHAENLLEERPWRLLLHGDTFEFLHLAPQGGPSAWEGPPDEASALLKLARLSRAARPAIEAMGRFLRAGHDLHFIVGNHDRELLLRPVARLLRRILFRASGLSRGEWKTHASRIAVHPWFYCEPGEVYVEHGNQFDEYASYTEVLEANPGRDSRTLEEPSSHAAVRYFVYRDSDLFAMHHVDDWTFIQYIRWGIEQGPLRGLKLLFGYVQLVIQLVRHEFGRMDFSERPSMRVQRMLEGLARRHGMRLSSLEALRRTWRRPATVFSVVRCYLADRFALVLSLVVAAAVIWTLGGATWTTAVSLPGLACAGALCWWLLSRMRNLDMVPQLERAAILVRRIAGVRIVAFGHSHVPVQQRLGKPGNWYLNPGGWDESVNLPSSFVLARDDEDHLRLVDSPSFALQSTHSA